MNIAKKIASATTGCVLAAAVLGCAAPASAADGADVYAGYQFLHVSSGGDGESAPLGLTAGVTFPMKNNFSVVGDFGWNHKKDDSGVKVTPVTFGGGLRYVPEMSGMPSFFPYLQAILGVEHTSASFGSFSSSSSDFMFQPGVGATFAVRNWTGFGELDYRHVSSDSGENDFVFRVGVIVAVGKK